MTRHGEVLVHNHWTSREGQTKSILLLLFKIVKRFDNARRRIALCVFFFFFLCR